MTIRKMSNTAADKFEGWRQGGKNALDDKVGFVKRNPTILAAQANVIEKKIFDLHNYGNEK